jgi:hypothetical protein
MSIYYVSQDSTDNATQLPDKVDKRRGVVKL